MTETHTPPTPERLDEIERLLRNESSISFSGNRAKESMLLLLAEAHKARKLRAMIGDMKEDVQFLRALEAAGGDSWEGREVAVEILNQPQDAS